MFLADDHQDMMVSLSEEDETGIYQNFVPVFASLNFIFGC